MKIVEAENKINIISENESWIKEAIGLLYSDSKYKKLVTMDDVLLTLAIPSIGKENIQVTLGIFTQDAPNSLVPVEEMKITYPEAKFNITYPTKEYIFAKILERKHHNTHDIVLYEKIFGTPQHHGKYLTNLYFILNVDFYNEAMSKLLGYQLLNSHIERDKEAITHHVQLLATYFNGVPTELRDYYLTENEPFFHWMLKYL